MGMWVSRNVFQNKKISKAFARPDVYAFFFLLLYVTRYLFSYFFLFPALLYCILNDGFEIFWRVFGVFLCVVFLHLIPFFGLNIVIAHSYLVH